METRLLFAYLLCHAEPVEALRVTRWLLPKGKTDQRTDLRQQRLIDLQAN